jgi:hypothetical protein
MYIYVIDIPALESIPLLYRLWGVRIYGGRRGAHVLSMSMSVVWYVGPPCGSYL